MKKIVKAYISFTRPETAGLLLLSLLLIILITVRASMHLWVKPENDTEKEGKLLAAWEDFKHQQPTATVQYTKTYKDSNTDTAPATRVATATEAVPAHLFRFDPNTLDSIGFRRLGLRAGTTAILLHWRAKGKVFRKKEDLKGVYTLKPEEYTRIEPYIVINNNAAPGHNYQDAFDDNETPLSQIINLNKADSATLVRLKGIGPVTAQKIVERRKNVGPFTSIDQLLEIRHFPKATFEVLKQHLRIR